MASILADRSAIISPCAGSIDCRGGSSLLTSTSAASQKNGNPAPASLQLSLCQSSARQKPKEPVRDLRRLVGQLWVGGDFKLFALCDRRYGAVATGSSYRRSPVGGRTYRASPTSSRIRRTCSWIMESRPWVGSWSNRMSISWREWLMEALVWISKSSCATVGGLPSCRDVHYRTTVRSRLPTDSAILYRIRRLGPGL
jgi:hypothetical protein